MATSAAEMLLHYDARPRGGHVSVRALLAGQGNSLTSGGAELRATFFARKAGERVRTHWSTCNVSVYV